MLRRIAFACLVLFCSVPLFARDWRIADFHDTINVTQDGSISVRERITLAFIGEWHGIHRTIPTEYPGPRGTNYTLFLDVTSVTDGDGQKLEYESKTSGGTLDLKIFIPNAVDTTRTVEINYIVRNAIRHFEDPGGHDEFYWNVTGNDWPVPIDHVSAEVLLPQKASGQLKAQAFTGTYGSTSHEVTSNVDGASTSFETTNPLPIRGGMTIDVYIPSGIIEQPSAFMHVMWFLGSNPIVFLPFVTLAVMWAIWYYKGRDPAAGRSIAPMYEPPPGMTPAEAGTIVDDTVHPRDITCTLVDLAVRGYVKIEEVSDTTLLIFHRKDYIFHLLKDRGQWGDLIPFERVMLEHVFAGGGTATKLSSLKNQFYTALPIIRQDIMSGLRNKGMYLLDPESANAYSIAGALLSVAPFALMQFTGFKNVFSAVSPLIVAAMVSAMIWWLFAREMKAHTVKGAQARIHVLGFQEFMTRVDADRLKRMPPDTFEKFLPFAMALGVEHNWAQAFAGIVQNPPTWYASPGGYSTFNPIFFSNSVHSMASDMHQTFVSAPRASSSGSGWSGGGGGGFSGGGFGGGGGSAF
jgi:hypothetical protein